MSGEISAIYPKGNGIVRGVKRAKNLVKAEKIRAAKVDIKAGGAAGALTYLLCIAQDLKPVIAPFVAVVLTPIIGKHLFDRYKDVKDAKNEYNKLKNTDEYLKIIKRKKFMEKRKMLRSKHVLNILK